MGGIVRKSILAVSLIAVTLAGCNVKRSDDFTKETDEIIKKSQQDVGMLTSSLNRGGQAGDPSTP